jgi:hypothetical protein
MDWKMEKCKETESHEEVLRRRFLATHANLSFSDSKTWVNQERKFNFAILLPTKMIGI